MFFFVTVTSAVFTLSVYPGVFGPRKVVVTPQETVCISSATLETVSVFRYSRILIYRESSGTSVLSEMNNIMNYNLKCEQY